MDECTTDSRSEKRPTPSEDTSRAKRGKYTSAACNLCKKRKLRCVPSQDGGSCQRCAGAELLCVFDAPSRQAGREKTENSNNDQLRLLLSELAGLRRQVGDLAGAVHELQQSVYSGSNDVVKNVSSPSHGRAFADSPNTQAPGLRRKPKFMGPTRPDFDFQVGERALHRMGIPLVSSDSDGEAVAHSCSQSPVPSTPTETATAAAAATAEASAGGSFHPHLRWTTDEIVRLLGVYDEDVNSVFPCIDVADLAAQPQAIRDDVLRCLRQQESVLLPDTRASAGAGDAALARVVIATAVVLEARGRNTVSEMLVSPVERNVSCIASPEPDMKEVQLLAVLSIYYFHIDQDLLAWRAISVAAHEMLEMGLHRKQSLLENYKSSNARQLATRVFWCVYVLDRRWSIGISLPFALRDRDLDPELPEPGLDLPYLQSMVGYGRLCSQLWDAIPVLHSTGGAGGLGPRQLLQDDQVALLDLRVQEWLAQIPAELQLRHPRLGLAPRVQPHVLHRLRTLLYLRANSLRILLHRHRLRSPTAIEADPHGAWLVVDIAMDSIQVLFHLNETTDIYARQQRAFNYFLLSALAVLFLAVCHAPRIFTEPCRRSFGDAVALIRCFSHDRTVSRRLWRSIRGLLPALRRLGLHEDGQKAVMATSASRAPSAATSVATAATEGTEAVAPVQYVEAHNTSTAVIAGDAAGRLQMWNAADPYMQMGDSLYDDTFGGPVPDMFQVDTDLLTLFDIFGQGQQLDEGLHADVFADGPLVGEGGGISQRFQWLI
ncbi:fungal specific transcription factor domain containing protein [Grosmannia clavigera kw1407]|uniref:Fungal specific transcription factor domain containing protein n=1 Tax=Grosmannia clavigera (strain kw1407 / UAMH 11150) TaxID=655863 RepID=F0XV60_GROCL|nr:fungal specific transcription factor domain containing protein [Grosmannia clavigera kw1407]EFW98471.1 fungal specific transcription factor domain containing protein [Grosmannia clavigera kw1407]